MGDQLNANHSWFKKKDASILYVIAELKQETYYVKHHVQKICAFFLSMMEFAQALSHAGHHVIHMTLDDCEEFAELDELLIYTIKKYNAQSFSYQRPDEYRLLKQLRELRLPNHIVIKEYDTEHFLLPYEEIPSYFTQGKHHKMEFFYRKMRRGFDVLMEKEQPQGGKWNFDSDNRKNFKAADIQEIPSPLTFKNDVTDIIKRLDKHKVSYFGKVENQLLWPKNRKQALQVLRYFCKYNLPKFGKFQDAMTANSEYSWSLYHSRLSFALNSKMLHPKTILDETIAYYKKSEKTIDIAQIEGFVRQILGWREYIRGVYWANMPGYSVSNHLQAKQDLPHFFWTANTKMNCMKHAIGQSLNYAYAHHIQRLMVTGNFCLLTGIKPEQVDEWYLGIYIDAIEWVEMPNTRGMSQFADGGLVATKPYIAGGNYINKMSDYCKSCHYSVKHKAEENACPFNSLYWHFMSKHRQILEKNPRISMVYRNWDKQPQEQRNKVLTRAQWCLENIENL